MAIIDKINIRGNQYDLRDNDAQAAIAPLYSTSATYAVGDYVMHDGAYYVCKTAIATPESWTAGHWMQTNVGAEAGGLKSAINTLDGVIYPNVDVLLKTDSGSLAAQNQYWELGTLVKNHAYRIWLKFSEDPVCLSNLRTSKSESGAGNVDTVTDSFVGTSWTSGKTLIYTPTVDDIKYFQIQFNSSYTANEYSAELKLYDYTKETTSAITELKDADSVMDARINALEPTIILSDDYNLLPPGGYTLNKLILPNGTISNYNGYVLSDYIELDPSQEYICNFAKTASVVYGNSGLTGNINTFDRMNFCFFDENKNVVPYMGDTTAISKAIPDGAKYIRVCVVSESVYPLARLIYGNYNTQPTVRIVDYKQRLNFPYLLPNTGYENFKMVMFGDSITHGSLSAGDAGISYVDYANDALNANIINVGFGGTRMTYALEDAGLFCFYNLCDCITSESADAWADLDAYAEDNTTYAEHLATLKAIDWSTVNAIGLMYGANDYASNTPIGTEYNETITNYDGACAYGLKKLLTKYPHLQVLLLGPFDRELTGGDATTMTDRAENTAGLLMSDYADSLENVVSRYHCPLVKTGKEWGINEYTILTYAPDGTHPRANIAQKRLGWLFANVIKRYLAPFN